MLPVVLVDELLRLHGIGVKLAESVFSSGDGGFHPIQAPVRDTRWCRSRAMLCFGTVKVCHIHVSGLHFDDR